MFGWRIFKHAVLMIVRNFPSILRLAAFPAAICSLVLFVLFYFSVGTGASIGNSLPVLNMSVLLPGWIVFLFCNFWVIVSWHRFVLLEELPNGWINRPNKTIGAYILTVIKLLFVMFFALMPVLLVIMLTGGVNVTVGALFAVYGVFVLVIFARVSLILPAAAIGRDLTVAEALDHTKGQTVTLITLFVCVFLFALLMQGIIALLSVIPLLGLLVALIIQVVLSMLNVSILTTMYGIFVEHREL